MEVAKLGMSALFDLTGQVAEGDRGPVSPDIHAHHPSRIIVDRKGDRLPSSFGSGNPLSHFPDPTFPEEFLGQLGDRGSADRRFVGDFRAGNRLPAADGLKDQPFVHLLQYLRLMGRGLFVSMAHDFILTIGLVCKLFE